MSTVNLNKDDYKVEKFEDYLTNSFYDLDGMDTFYFTYTEDQTVLQLLYDAINSYNKRGNADTYYTDMVEAQEDLSAASTKYEEAVTLLSELQSVLTELGSASTEYESIPKNFADIVATLLAEESENGGEGSLKVFASNLTIFQEALNLGNGFDEFTNNINTLVGLLEGLTIDNFGYKIETIKSTLKSIYSYTSSSEFSILLQCATDTSSVEYINTLFAFAISSVHADFCAEGDNNGALLTTDTINIIDDDISNMVNAGALSKVDFVNLLTDDEKKTLISGNVIYNESTDKYQYNGTGTKYDSLDDCLNANLNQIDDIFSAAITAGTFLENVNVKNLILSTLSSDTYRNTTNSYLLKVKQSLVANSSVKDFVNYRMKNYVDMISQLELQIKSLEQYFYSNTTGDRLNTSADTSEFSKDAGWDGLITLYENYKAMPSTIQSIVAEYYTWDSSKSVAGNVSDAKEALGKLITAQKTTVTNAESAYIKEKSNYTNAKSEYDAATASYQELLDLALRYNTFDGSGSKITAITKSADGTYTATSTTITSIASNVLTTEKALQNLSVPYFALAVCLEKAYIVKDVMIMQVQAIEEINEKITENNNYLKKANKIYEEYYNRCIGSSGGSYSVNDADFINYLKDPCGYETDLTNFSYHVYNTEGGTSGGDYQNIDVAEQGNLTKISNAQEAIRMYGDELSTESQMATTKLQQYTQNYTNCVSICSQLAKSTGEYFKSIAANVR